jgi:hypothetical protein
LILRSWAARHGVPFAAILELEQLLGASAREVIAGLDLAPDAQQASESRVQSLVRLEAAQKGVMLARNNVGALPDKSGRFVRYGLFNESPAQNARLKSPDLVGWRPRIIGPADVGNKIAQFVGREVKEEGWQYDPNDEHQAAQMACIQLIVGDGGDAAFCTGVGTL